MADIGTDSFIQIKEGDWENLNRALRYIYNQLDAITGRRGLGADPTQKYTPISTDFVNLSETLLHEIGFVRVLDTVVVFGSLSAHPDTAAILTSFQLSLPVPAKFTNEWDAGGTGYCPGAVMGASILAGVANQTAIFQWIPPDNSFRRFSFIFAYHVSQ